LLTIFVTGLWGGIPLDVQQLQPGVRDDGRYRVWVYFTDKGEALAEPGAMLEPSPATIHRRAKVGVGPVTWYDRWPAGSYVAAVEATGVTLLHQSRWLNAVSVLATEAQLQAIAALPFVKTVTPVMQYRRRPFAPPADKFHPGFFRRDSLDYGAAQDQIEQINVSPAHAAGYTGQGVTVLVMDTGFNLSHPAFDSLEVIAQWDVIENDSITANQTHDDSLYGQHNHGTMVLSTLAGYAPGALIGPAFGARFLLAKTEMLMEEIQVEEDNYVAGLEWGEANGADVVSTSLGYLDWYSYCDLDGNTAVTTKAVDIAVSLGVVCVTAAGNQGWQEPPDDPCDTLTYYVIAPADADSVISVGAVTADGLITNFSSHGPTYDGRIKPEVCARGYRTACVTPNDTGYTVASGTSLATPLVGGAAAVILSAHPDWTPMMVREALLSTASRAADPDNDYGYGIIDVWAAIQYDQFQDTTGPTPLPTAYRLYPAYPNPFNPRTTIAYDLPEADRVTLGVYDLLGREVAILVRGYRPAGGHQAIWSGRDDRGRPVSSGVYLIRLTTPRYTATGKVLLLR
jgi:subtilisin family serine protease